MSFVPPPFPFPEAWPQLFRSQQATWLTPSHPWLPVASADPASVALHPPTAAQAPFGLGSPPATFLPGAHGISSAIANSSRDRIEGEDRSDESEEDGGEDGSDEGEFVSGYVLSDEWRSRFRSSHHARQQRLRQQQQQQRRTQKQQLPKANGARAKKRRQQLAASMSDLAVRDLQRELVAATQREVATRRALPTADGELEDEGAREALQDVRRLEAQLNLRFDAFCDAFTPVVWPHD